jgi:hypothetical protein
MYEYYHDGNNVLQTDETRIPILDQLSHVLDLQYELDHLYDDLEPAIIDYTKDGSWTVSRNKESATKVQALLEKESELYKSIYKFIGEHLEEWWD